MATQYTIGELAAGTGLTVRTLHHYDHIGLLKPSERSPSGYRLYGDDDVRRLYRIVALRQLGLGLKDIDAALAGDWADLREAIARHLAEVERQNELGRSLEKKLRRLLDQTEQQGDTSSEQFIDAMETIVAQETSFTQQQRAELATLARQVGERMVPFVERQTELMVLITSEMEEGTDPSDPRVQDLVGVWLECMQSVAGHEVSRETLAKSILHSSNLSASDLPSPNALSYLGNALAFTDR